MLTPRAHDLGLAAVALTSLLTAAAAGNHVTVVLERVADDFVPSAHYYALIGLALPDVAGVTGVTLTTPTGPVALENEDDAWWGRELDFADFADLKAAMNGTMTIAISGASSSTTTFALDLTTLTDDDLFATPAMIDPTSGATGVAADVEFTWTDPTGPVTPDAVFVEVDSNDAGTWQEASNLDGTLAVTATSWTPPLELGNGANEFAIMYLVVDPVRAGPFNVTEGTVAWSASPEAPPGYPADTPLLVRGSETIIAFTVGTPCPADVDGNGSVGFSDILAIIGSWGPCPGGCPADVNGDGSVGFGDILGLFSSWGPCG